MNNVNISKNEVKIFYLRLQMMRLGRNDPCPCGSGRKYKKCCIDRASKKIFEFYNELNGLTSGFSPETFLTYLQHKSLKIKNDYFITENNLKITNFTLDFICRFLIKNSKENGKEFIGEDFYKIVNLVSEIEYDGLENEVNNLTFDYFIKSIFYQSSYKKSLKGFTDRILLFYKFFKNYDKDKFDFFIDLQNEIKKTFKMDIFSFFFIGFAIYTQIINFGSIDLENLIHDSEEKLKEILTKENVNKFLVITSKEQNTIRVDLNESLRFTNDTQFELSILKKFPLINYKNRFYLPVVINLLNRISNGVFYDFSNFFMGEKKQNVFRTFFGKHVFEPYVVRILQEHFNKNEVFRGEDIVYPANIGEYDILIVREDNCYLIECWLGSTNRYLREKLDKEKLKEYELRLLDEIFNLYKKYSYLVKEKSIRLSGSQNAFEFKNIFPILLTYEDIPFLNSYFRMRAEMALSESRNQAYDNLKASIVNKEFLYHMLGLSELEYLINVVNNGYKLDQLLIKKCENNYRSVFDIKMYFLAKLIINKASNENNDDQIRSFCNYIESDFKDFIYYGLNESLKFSLYKNAWDELKEILGLNS